MNRQLGSKYILEDSIGRGAMGEVFRGHDHQGTALAFKVLHPDLASDADVVGRFVKERGILEALKSPNLVGVVDLVVEGATLAIVMELVDGPDLRSYLSQRGTLAPSEVCRIGSAVATGLAAVHAAGIVHRDIKPENVLMKDSDSHALPKLTDFGISSLVDTERARSTMLVGTPQYIAPEVSEGHDVTASSDLYALGIMLYELACGVTPFAGGSVMAVLRRHSDVLPGRPDSLPDELWDLISWLLNKQPGQRPPTARQVATILDALGPSLTNFPPGQVLTEPPAPVTGLQSGVTMAVPFTQLPATSALPRQGAPDRPAALPLPPAPAPAAAASVPDKPNKKRRLVIIAGIAAAVLAVSAGAFTAVNALSGAGKDATASETAVASQSATATSSISPSASASAQSTSSASASAAASASGFVNVVGKLLPDAQKTLGTSVTVQVVDKYDATKPDGTVLAQAAVTGSTSRIELTVARSEVVAYLADRIPVSGRWGNFEPAVTISGTTYAHSVAAQTCGYNSGESVEYNLGRNYQTFNATAGLGDGSQDSTAVVLVEVFADGRKVSSQSVTYGQAFPINADMTDVLRMKIQWQPTSCNKNNGSANLALGSAKLLGLPGRVPVPTTAP
ncbi:protein kinase domain-containing protein [Arthrobacter sp. UYEF6]|uniref:protein kinase domain-containing protein n=1 Tax=unclassified Pseudarthrobacter TaxID=2647000 RepID=UPI003398A67A